jgi:cytochrome c oxidase subunit 4
MPKPQLTVRVVFANYLALMALLVLTAVLSHLPLGNVKGAVSLLIAAIKMTLIFLFFMRLRYARGLIRIFAGAGFLWLLFMGTLDFTDYLTR